MTGRRLFNTTEKTVLYIAADGKCENCGEELKDGWHADHVHPHSKGGATALVNGQALCPTCNLTKGATLETTTQDYTDTFEAREFQTKLISAVLDNHAAGKKTTVAIASPGSGKTLAYQAAATHLIREGAIDLVAVYAPRRALTSQCEIEYRDAADNGHFHMFDATNRLEYIAERDNKPPLTPPGANKAGFATTYSSLVNNPHVHEDWAKRHSGRFLLVGDEAQFLGSTSEDLGTASARNFKMMSEHAAHTVLLTGTEARSDGQKIELAEYERREDDQLYLLADVRSTYSEGIAQGYLRPFEAYMVNADVTRTDYSGDAPVTTESKLSINDEQLTQVLKQSSVWRNLVDNVVEKLRDAQFVHPGHKALIACLDQEQAKSVHKYLQDRGVRSDLSISEDGPEAARTLNEFKTNNSDVLVSVRKAFLGYDCKAITVVGLLTNYRDRGHLEQLLGRGLRVWGEVETDLQFCRVVAPNDSRMARFLDALMEESAQGIQGRIDIGCGPGRGPGVPTPPSVIVEDALATEVTAFGHAGEVNVDGMSLVDYYHSEFPGTRWMKAGELVRLINHASNNDPKVQPAERPQPGVTRKQMIDELTTEADGLMKRIATQYAGPYSRTNSAWTREKMVASAKLNERFSKRKFGRARKRGKNEEWFLTVDDARMYLDAAKGLYQEMVGRWGK